MEESAAGSGIKVHHNVVRYWSDKKAGQSPLCGEHKAPLQVNSWRKRGARNHRLRTGGALDQLWNHLDVAAWALLSANTAALAVGVVELVVLAWA